MATDTTEQFDPYRKWLGIPPKDQPPHHYRLLGIAAFENDPDVIQNAADRQMAHVRNFQRGKHADDSQKILNELAVAKVCLLTQGKKSEYDQQLRVRLLARKAAANAQAGVPVAQVAVPVAAVPNPPVGEAVAPAIAEPPSAEPSFPPSPKISARKPAVHRRRSKKSTLPIAIAVVCLAFLVVGGIVAVSQIGGKKDQPSSDDDANAGDKPITAPKKTNNITPTQDNRTPKRGAVTPRTNKQTRTDPNRPFESVFANPMPAKTPSSADREKELREALDQLRQALANRDETPAATHLAKADTLKQSDEESTEVEKLRTLSAYSRGFWDGVNGGVKNFENSTSFEFQGRKYEFVSKDAEILTFKVDGAEIATKVKELAPSDAVAIAMQELDESNVFDKFYVIAFLAIDNRGDLGKQRGQASQMLRETIKQGQRNAVLIAELELEAEFPATNTDLPESPHRTPLGGIDTSPANSALAPIPSAEDQRTARAAMMAQHGSSVRNARTIQAKIQLANELSEKANNEPDLKAKYQLFQQALSLAIEARQLDLCLTIVDSTAKAFEIDVLSEKEKALDDLVTKPDVDVAAISQQASELYQQAVSDEKVNVARRLGETRKRAAKRMNQNDLVRKIDEELRELGKQPKAGEPDQIEIDQAGS